MSWETWIERNMNFSNFDDLLDYLIDEFNINGIGQTNYKVDLRQFVALWWFDNKYKFKRYNTNALVAGKLGLRDHSSVTHLTNYRIPTKDYDKNTKPLAEAVKNHYICV